ncbi:hypothetical protein J2T57_000776 [Natronocella acetinitrilica]|uniref:Lipoprotein n=1 Tax=Natronocella acetinitrilica TaxID=414046 RepID=A0AAE3G4D5_9GAMM|nr:hypothetical protein [Natronocella acetinitrilica]MCP1673677.1 hypothetical protein [Natronocella acetinitrilica]
MTVTHRSNPLRSLSVAVPALLLAGCLGGGSSGGGGGGAETAELEPLEERLAAAARTPADLSSHDEVAKRWLLARELGLFLELPALLPGEFLHPFLSDELACEEESQLELTSEMDVERDPTWFGELDLQTVTFVFDQCSVQQSNEAATASQQVNGLLEEFDEDDLIPIEDEVSATSQLINGQIAVTTRLAVNEPMLESVFRVQVGVAPESPWRLVNGLPDESLDYRILGDVRAAVRNGFRFRRGQYSLLFLREQDDDTSIAAYLAVTGTVGSDFDIILQPGVQLLRGGNMEIAIDLQAGGEGPSCPVAGRFALTVDEPIETAIPDGGGGITGGALTIASPDDEDPERAVEGSVQLMGDESFVVTIDDVAQSYDAEAIELLASPVNQCLFD